MCICECVTNTTKTTESVKWWKRLIKVDYIFLNGHFFLWFETVGVSEARKSLIVKVFWRNECLRGLSIFVAFDVCWFQTLEINAKMLAKKSIFAQKLTLFSYGNQWDFLYIYIYIYEKKVNKQRQ